jgi:hypothetical protein
MPLEVWGTDASPLLSEFYTLESELPPSVTIPIRILGKIRTLLNATLFLTQAHVRSNSYC